MVWRSQQTTQLITSDLDIFKVIYIGKVKQEGFIFVQASESLLDMYIYSILKMMFVFSKDVHIIFSITIFMTSGLKCKYLIVLIVIIFEL